MKLPRWDRQMERGARPVPTVCSLESILREFESRKNFAEEGDNCRPYLDLSADSTLRCFQAVPYSVRVQKRSGALDAVRSKALVLLHTRRVCNHTDAQERRTSFSTATLFESPSVVCHGYNENTSALSRASASQLAMQREAAPRT